MDKKKIRCAIYTRKSTEEGLEQDFNSLDAQREACEAYIKSQIHEGWILLNKQYNDGGFSGGTMERPAFKELLMDIENDKIDIVIVYKVDRLTRSLMDFSKIIDIFDRHKTSFVSITQQFNTTTSMGRLTLNMLLSFAQFEREVTSERLRDKFAASRKKGMFLHGTAPIGYKKEKGTLIEIPEQSVIIKNIFTKYLEFNSTSKLQKYLVENNIKTPNNKIFSIGHLNRILNNKVYIGKITYKNEEYEGLHNEIIEKTLFEKVQKSIKNNKGERKFTNNNHQFALLASKLFDDKGNYMSPTYSYNRHKKRYRYYVSTALKNYKINNIGSISKIPAGEIEKFVIETTKEFLQDKEQIQHLVSKYPVRQQNKLICTAQNIQNYSNPKLIKAIIHKIVVSQNVIEITYNAVSIKNILNALANNQEIVIPNKKEKLIPITISKNIKITQLSRNDNILILNANEYDTPTPNLYLVNAIVKSFYYHRQIQAGKTIEDLQTEEGLKDSKYIRNILNLKYLSPKLIEQILTGTQSNDLSLQKLITMPK